MQPTLLNRLQLIQNSLVQVVVRAHKWTIVRPALNINHSPYLVFTLILTAVCQLFTYRINNNNNNTNNKFSHIDPSLKSLPWLKTEWRIDYKILSLTHKVRTTTRPSYLYDLMLAPSQHSFLRCCHPLCFCLKVNNRSFRYTSLYLWNELPKELHQPVTITLTPVHDLLRNHFHDHSFSFPLHGQTLKLTFFINTFHHGLTDP